MFRRLLLWAGLVGLAVGPVRAQTAVMPVPLVGSTSGLDSSVNYGSGQGLVSARATSFYGVTITLSAGQGPGRLMLFDADTIPADGLVNPTRCVYIGEGARTTVYASSGFPLSFRKGLVWAFSSGATCQAKVTAPAEFVGLSYKVQPQ